MEEPASLELITPYLEFSPDLNIWERQPDEPQREWLMFSCYLDLPPAKRNLVNAYRAFLASIGRTSRTAERRAVTPYFFYTSKQYRWRERSDAYERHISTQARDQIIEQRIASRVETAALGRILRQKAAEAAAQIQSIVAVKKGGEVVFRSALTTREITQLAKVGAELERAALGMGTSGSHHQIDINVNTAPPDEEEIMKQAERILEERKKIIDAELSRDSPESPRQRSTDMDIEKLLRT